MTPWLEDQIRFEDDSKRLKSKDPYLEEWKANQHGDAGMVLTYKMRRRIKDDKQIQRIADNREGS